MFEDLLEVDFSDALFDWFFLICQEGFKYELICSWNKSNSNFIDIKIKKNVNVFVWLSLDSAMGRLQEMWLEKGWGYDAYHVLDMVHSLRDCLDTQAIDFGNVSSRNSYGF